MGASLKLAGLQICVSWSIQLVSIYECEIRISELFFDYKKIVKSVQLNVAEMRLASGIYPVSKPASRTARYRVTERMKKEKKHSRPVLIPARTGAGMSWLNRPWSCIRLVFGA